MSTNEHERSIRCTTFGRDDGREDWRIRPGALTASSIEHVKSLGIHKELLSRKHVYTYL